MLRWNAVVSAAVLVVAFAAAPAMAAQPASPTPAAADWHATVRSFALQHFKNPAWGYSHSQRDYSLARDLAAADHVALDVARIMALTDPNGGDPTGPKSVKMLEENLAKVPARVVSPAGRATMPQRKAELEQFLKDLRRESDNLRTL